MDGLVMGLHASIFVLGLQLGGVWQLVATYLLGIMECFGTCDLGM